MEYVKRYVRVNVDYMPDGTVIPKLLYWDVDGYEMPFEIDKVVDVRQSYSHKVGGQGTLYRVMIAGRERSLFFDGLEERFFVEEIKRSK